MVFDVVVQRLTPLDRRQQEADRGAFFVVDFEGSTRKLLVTPPEIARAVPLRSTARAPLLRRVLLCKVVVVLARLGTTRPRFRDVGRLIHRALLHFAFPREL
jgi:hypothetical protein